jgi:hypothetical protein
MQNYCLSTLLGFALICNEFFHVIVGGSGLVSSLQMKQMSYLRSICFQRVVAISNIMESSNRRRKKIAKERFKKVVIKIKFF